MKNLNNNEILIFAEHGLNAPGMENHPLFYNYRREPLMYEVIPKSAT